MTAEIYVLHSEYTARLELVEKSAQSCPRITKVGKNKADIYEIIPIIRLRAGCNILRPEVNILNPKALRFLLGEQDLRTIEVDARHMPTRHHAAERYSDVTTTTAHIEASCIRGKRKAFQKLKRGWRHDAGKNSQPLSTFNSTPNQIVVRQSHWRAPTEFSFMLDETL